MQSNGYTYTGSTTTRIPFDQTRDLCLAYTAASQAEKDINIREEEVIDNMKTNHVLAAALGVPVEKLGVNSSVCEETLKKLRR